MGALETSRGSDTILVIFYSKIICASGFIARFLKIILNNVWNYEKYKMTDAMVHDVYG